MKVVALETGYFGGRIQNEGDTFDVATPQELAGWMKVVKDDTPKAPAKEPKDDTPKAPAKEPKGKAPKTDDLA